MFSLKNNKKLKIIKNKCINCFTRRILNNYIRVKSNWHKPLKWIKNIFKKHFFKKQQKISKNKCRDICLWNGFSKALVYKDMNNMALVQNNVLYGEAGHVVSSKKHLEMVGEGGNPITLEQIRTVIQQEIRTVIQQEIRTVIQQEIRTVIQQELNPIRQDIQVIRQVLIHVLDRLETIEDRLEIVENIVIDLGDEVYGPNQPPPPNDDPQLPPQNQLPPPAQDLPPPPQPPQNQHNNINGPIQNGNVNGGGFIMNQMHAYEHSASNDNNGIKSKQEIFQKLRALKARKATLLTRNEGLEPATNWIMQHLKNFDLNEPHPSFKKEPSAVGALNEKILQLTNLGFSSYQATYALNQTNCDTNVAAEWLFNHSNEIPPESTSNHEDSTHEILAPKEMRKGIEKYNLISHMGSSPHSGHYLAYVKRDNGIQSVISQWDGEERQVSKAAEHLDQIPFDGKSLPYEGWTCAKCDLKENLWLNLSDGVIMCGRYAPMSGVKGNGHAKTHYEETGYPLVVKLGTIADGDGDFYSYSEDAPVRDPFLAKHLAHFGLSIDKFTKTEKTTLELELDANLKHEFSVIQEEGATLKSVYGSGFTGLINLGSSCYINAVLQMLYNVPDFLQVYGNASENIFNKLSPLKSYEDFNCQFAKIFKSLKSGEYSKEGEKENGIRPFVFRRLAGRGHVEFSTAKQQDAEEYIRHLFDKIDQNVYGDVNPVNSFRFLIVNRFVDELSGCVRYLNREETILSLPVPFEECRDSPVQVGPVTRKLVQLQSCLAKAFAEEYIDDYTSPVLKIKGKARQELKMGGFPDFLIIQIRRFTHDDNYQVKKLDVDVEIDENIDLSAFYSEGKLQPNESPLPEDENSPTSDNHGINLKQEIVQQLMEMGFTENAAKKATLLTKNEGLETATNWIMQHLEDSDLNEPHPSFKKESSVGALNEKICQLTSLGFTSYQAKYALNQTNFDTNVAAEWLFNHSNEIPIESTSTQEDSTNETLAPKEMRKGIGKYNLCAFISHMGSSPHSGHYVAHVKRDNGIWYIFNDEKVAISQNPPKSLGYLYLYKRDSL